MQTWVRAAEAGTNDLQVISAEEARPGDIVTYDWGGQEDFGADGHIGFLASNVEGEKFTALEGNNQDAVTSVPRSTSQANVKFIRIGGTGSVPPGTPAPGAPVTPAPGAPPPAPPRRTLLRITLQEIADPANGCFQVIHPRQGHHAEVVRPRPVERGALNDQ